MTADQRFDRLDANIERLTHHFLAFRQETAPRLQTMDGRFDVLASTIASLDSRHPALTKAILDFGALATQLQRRQL